MRGSTNEASGKSGGRPSDHDVRKRVVCPHDSFLVRAPAGSGKTKLVAERYCELLKMLTSQGRGPENILCLTFTRKAAGEMRGRIQDMDVVKERNVRNRVNVQTIDGFQRALACTDSLRAAMMPRFRTTGKRDYFHRAIDESWKNEGRSKQIDEMEWIDHSGKKEIRMKDHFSQREIRMKTVDMLKKRDQWMQWSKRVDELEEGGIGRRVLQAVGAIGIHLDKIYGKERDYDFIAVSQAATKLVGKLGKPPCLESVLGDPILHILVDEFQDVSAAQYRFLESLVSGWKNGDQRSFFAVGDSMQSIYRFRGAGTDVIYSMFEKEVRGSEELKVTLGELDLTVEELRSNFRSCEQIVSGVYNLLDKGSNRVEGRASLVKAEAEKPGGGEFSVEIFRSEKDEARWVAEQIDKYKNEGRCEEEYGSEGRCKLAILVRARSYFTRLIQPQLENLENIDVDFTPLDRLACVNDMSTLARCIEDPDDEVASLALLRSPLLPMTSTDLHAFYAAAGAGDDGEYRKPPLSKLLEESKFGCSRYLDRLEMLDETTVDAFQNFVTTFWRARAEVGTMPVRSWLERAWFRMGGGAIYHRQVDRLNIEQFLDLVEEVNGKNRSCDWRELNRRMRFARGMSRCPEAKVKIMTIHAAKGLQFKNVIVPFLHSAGQSSKRDLAMIGEKEGDDRRRKVVVDDKKKRDGRPYERVSEVAEKRE